MAMAKEEEMAEVTAAAFRERLRIARLHSPTRSRATPPPPGYSSPPDAAGSADVTWFGELGPRYQLTPLAERLGVDFSKQPVSAGHPRLSPRSSPNRSSAGLHVVHRGRPNSTPPRPPSRYPQVAAEVTSLPSTERLLPRVSPVVPSRVGRLPPATPPPTYPSPPTYTTPPRLLAFRERQQSPSGTQQSMAAQELRGLGPNGSGRRGGGGRGRGNEPDVEPVNINDDEPLLGMWDGSDDETGGGDELAPAYRDDIGCCKGLQREKNLIAMLLTAALYVLIGLLVTETYGFLHLTGNEFRALFLIVYGMYMIEALGCTISGYLWQHNGDDNEGHERVRRMLDNPPWIRWTLHSYHYPSLQAEYEGRPGNRVRTFTARGEYELNGCADISDATVFTSHRLCLMEFKRDRAWRDSEAKAQYDMAKTAFIEMNRRDTHVQFIEEWGIDSWFDELLLAREGESMPYWSNWFVFLLATVFFGSYWYRVVFGSRIGTRTIVIKKEIW